MSARRVAICAILALTAVPQMAAAQTASCLTRAELADAAVFGMPGIVTAMQSRCGRSLSSSGYLARSGPALIEKYRAQQDRTWPAARKTMQLVVAAKSAEGNTNPMMAQVQTMLRNMPARTAAPFVEAMIAQEVGKALAGADCRETERVMELVSPLPVRNVGELFAIAAGQMAKRDAALPVCRAD